MLEIPGGGGKLDSEQGFKTNIMEVENRSE